MKFHFLILLFLVLPAFTSAQDNFTISGHVKDEASGEELIGANVYVEEIESGSITNVYGFYSITLPKGKYNLMYSFIGYEPIKKEVSLQSDTKMNIELKNSDETIEEVKVTAERRDRNVQDIEMSTTKLPIKTIQRIPALMGEVDVIKSIQLLPGVQSGGEGSIGYYVRGGGVDQNLILLDEATVYNASHLGGLFSVFNQDAVKDVKLYKGGIPAEYGGRLSSLLDVRMKDGNSREFTGSGGIGILSSRLTLEAPIIEDRWSFIASGRRTYADLFFPLTKDSAVRQSKAFFYDFNLKTNYRLNDNNRFFLSGYFGNDVARFGKDFSFGYGNATATVRWNHLYGERLFSNLTLIYSQFDYNIGMPESVTSFDWVSQIKDYSVKYDYTFYINPANTMKFGIGSIYHTFSPGEMRNLGEESIFTELDLPENHALEHSAFIANEHDVTTELTLQYGLRFSAFQNIGSATFYEYDKTNPQEYVVTDTLEYGNNEIFNTYTAIEPRFNLRYKINPRSSLKATYNHTVQYLHLATNTMSPTPMDVWFPSSKNIKPQKADQVAAGYFHNFKDNMFEVSLETYYKKMYNIIDFRDHANIIANPHFEAEVRSGDAYSYGLEFLLRKQEGNLTGWLSYTWSKTMSQIDEINDGEEFPTPYDKRHDISIVLSYQLTERIAFGANWVYSSGAPRTMPVGRFEYGNMIAPVYSDRNSVRLPDYHRLDLSLTIDGKKPEDKKPRRNGKPRWDYQSSWNFSVYNAYNRHNAYSINFERDADNPDVMTAEKMYLFKVFPSITWNFRF